MSHLCHLVVRTSAAHALNSPVLMEHASHLQWYICSFSHPYSAVLTLVALKYSIMNILEIKIYLFRHMQVCNGIGDCSDSLLAPLKGPTDEEGCRSWSSWGPWSPCSATCGTGSMSRKRSCPTENPLYLCRGQALQRQQCFNTTCPGRGCVMCYVLTFCNELLMSSSILLSSERSVAAMVILVQLFQQLWWC